MRLDREAVREVAGIVMALSMVLGVTAGLLRVADSVPGLIRGEPKGATRLLSIDAAERRLGERLWLPAYFPDTLSWPPAAIVVRRGPPPSVAVTFVDRGGEPALVLGQSLGTTAPVPEELQARDPVLHRVTVPLHDGRATLLRLAGRDGRIWHDLAWEMEGRRIVLRSRGSVDELLRMARSVRHRP